MADDDDEIRPRRKAKGRNKGQSKKRRSGSFPLAWIIAGGSGCLVMFLLWSLLPILGGGWLAKGTPLDPAVWAKAAEDLQKDKEREKFIQFSIDSFVRIHGNGKHVTVIFENVRSDSDEVFNYLNQKVSQASRFDFEENKKREFEEWRKNPQKLIADAQARMKAGTPPPWPFPMPIVHPGSRRNSRMTFLAQSVLDLNQFVSRLGLGDNAKIDAGNRTVTLRLNLPNPLPAP